MRQETEFRTFREGPAAAARRHLIANGVMTAGSGTVDAAAAESRPPEVEVARHGTVRADGVDVVHREAGRPDASAFLLLHGFANSSSYVRHLMPGLADRFRLIAPDLPSLGPSAPVSRGFDSSPAAMRPSRSFTALRTHLRGGQHESRIERSA